MTDPVDGRFRNFVWNSERWKDFDLRRDDIIISTPPKCGTTWMQMQVALLLFRTPELPAPLAKLSPWLDMNTRPLAEVTAELEAQTHRRFIKSHTALDGLPWDDEVTYLHVCRDPRDVALSWDNHMANMDFDVFVATRIGAVGADDLEDLGPPPPPPPEDPVERFWLWVDGGGPSSASGAFGLPALVQHARGFWELRDRPNVHLFHYSDMRADLAGQMARLADALGVEPPTDELVDAARFETMKARADELVPNSDTPFWQSNERFFHKARSGDWRTLIDEGDLPRYDKAVRAITDDEEFLTWLHAGPLG